MTDLDAIRQAALDYVEGQYEGDEARVERCLHPLLAKRTIGYDERRQQNRIDQMGALELVQLTRDGVLADTPVDEQIKDVQILDVYGEIASVRVESHIFVDYLHIGRFNDQWMVINALWQFKPRGA